MRFAFIFSLICSFQALADVQSWQGSYRQLFEKITAAQNGESISTRELIYQLPETAFLEFPAVGPQSHLKNWNGENPVARQLGIIKELASKNQDQELADLFDRESLKKNPPTLVIVPGVFGEFIDPLAFNEITASETTVLARQFKKQIQELNAKQGACKTGAEVHCDSHFLLESMTLNGKVPVVKSLSDLVAVSSIDDNVGKPLVRVVIFKTPRLSLESIGQIKDVAAIFNRRLQKVFKVLGETPEYAYVGYSRGTMVALEMLQQSQDRKAKGLFVVGGVTFGSDLADQILVPGTPVNRQLSALKKLADNLSPNHGLGFFSIDAWSIRLENLMHWIQFAQEMSAIPGVQNMSLSERAAAAQNFLKTQVEKGRNSDPRAVVSLAMSVAANYGLIEQVSEFPFVKVKAALSHEDYSLNVLRFKHFVNEAYRAVIELTTQERIKWWELTKLPDNFTLYTFAATMADQKSSVKEESLLAQSQWASGPFQGADYMGLIENYRDFRKAGGASMNDSQVSVVKVIGWPEMINKLNPTVRIRTKFLALFGAHHWALALPVVNVNKDKSTNPFPRSALLESMGHVLRNSP